MEINKKVQLFLLELLFLFLMSFEYHSSIQFSDFTTMKPPECSYCTALLRYTHLIVQAVLHVNSVIVPVCKSPILQMWQTFN